MMVTLLRKFVERITTQNMHAIRGQQVQVYLYVASVQAHLDCLLQMWWSHTSSTAQYRQATSTAACDAACAVGLSRREPQYRGCPSHIFGSCNTSSKLDGLGTSWHRRWRERMILWQSIVHVPLVSSWYYQADHNHSCPMKAVESLAYSYIAIITTTQ
jgi:hypothetical protein